MLTCAEALACTLARMRAASIANSDSRAKSSAARSGLVYMSSALSIRNLYGQRTDIRLAKLAPMPMLASEVAKEKA